MRFMILPLLLLTSTAPAVYASLQVEVLYSGDATGSLNGTPFNSEPFYVDFSGDTAAASEPYGPGDGTLLPGVLTGFGIGQTTGSFTDPTSWFAGSPSGDVIFHTGVGYTGSPGVGTLGFSDFSLDDYNFTTSIGPLSEPGVIWPGLNFLGPDFQDIPTTQGLLTLTQTTNMVFQVTVTAVPEPATIWLITGGLACLVVTRRWGVFRPR